jgi:gamma-glutamyltranspeptidase/glutathione hydrolase
VIATSKSATEAGMQVLRTGCNAVHAVPKLSLDGYLAVGVPGTVAGMSAMLERFCTKKLSEFMQPAIKYAEKGFVLSARNAETFKEHQPSLSKYTSSRRYFLKPDGSTYREGDLLVPQDLAKTLRAIGVFVSHLDALHE